MSERKKFVIKATAFDKKGVVLAIALNDYFKSSPVQKALSIRAGLSEMRIAVHAEVLCLVRAKRLHPNKRVHTLLIERYDSEGKPRLAKPCASCELAIRDSRVQIVLYTSESGIQTLNQKLIKELL